MENLPKTLLTINSNWHTELKIVDKNALLHAILAYFENQKHTSELNNRGIPRMIRSYLYEMACVIVGASRLVKTGVIFFMVNNNVRYAGVNIFVYLILSSFAEEMGFDVEKLLFIPLKRATAVNKWHV
ncbi:MAG: hypothetical protein NZM04_00195 [Methylacidiphilales bacterium]|nr:hypothetical protein [Candidatus Methylacidiphilales bacterium]